jgi:hypothetical protein
MKRFEIHGMSLQEKRDFGGENDLSQKEKSSQ